MERNVRMLQASGKKKGAPKKKEPDQVLCGTPIYAARQRRVAAEARKEQIPELPLEVTQIAKVEEYLEYPSMSWGMEYPLELEKYQETDEYLPIPPPGSSVGRPLEFDRAINKDAPRTAPAGTQACDGTACLLYTSPSPRD